MRQPEDRWVWYPPNYAEDPSGKWVGWHLSILDSQSRFPGNMRSSAFNTWVPVDGRIRRSVSYPDSPTPLVVDSEECPAASPTVLSDAERRENVVTVQVTFTMDLTFSERSPSTGCLQERMDDYWEEAKEHWRKQGCPVKSLDQKLSGFGSVYTHKCGYCEEYVAPQAEIEHGIKLCPGCSKSAWTPVNSRP